MIKSFLSANIIFRVSVVLTLTLLTLRIYVGPEGNPDAGFPVVRKALDDFFAQTGLGIALYYWNWLLAGIAALALPATVIMRATQRLSGREFFRTIPFI